MDGFKEILTWGLPLAAFVGALVVLLLVKGLFFKRLAKWTTSTSVRWDDVLIRALQLPLNLFVIVLSLWVAGHFVNIPATYISTVTVLSKLLVILGCIYFIDRFFSGLLQQYANKSVIIDSSSKLITTGIHLVAMAFAALLILSALGISITPFIASLGIGSMAVALALQDTLANAFAGVHIMVDKPIARGDYISLDDGMEGFVETVGWRSTRLRLFSNNIVILPNSKLADSVITNFEMPDAAASMKVECGVHYDSDLDKVQRIVEDEAQKIVSEHPAGVVSFKPFVRFKEFSDSSINFYVILRAKRHVEHYSMKSDFIKRLHKRFNKEGIVIPYPIRTVHMVQEKKSS